MADEPSPISQGVRCQNRETQGTTMLTAANRTPSYRGTSRAPLIRLRIYAGQLLCGPIQWGKACRVLQPHVPLQNMRPSPAASRSAFHARTSPTAGPGGSSEPGSGGQCIRGRRSPSLCQEGVCSTTWSARSGDVAYDLRPPSGAAQHHWERDRLAPLGNALTDRAREQCVIRAGLTGGTHLGEARFPELRLTRKLSS